MDRTTETPAAGTSPPAKARPGRAPADAGVPPDAPVNLFGLDREAFAAWMAGLGEKPFRARQVMKWLYGKGVRDPALMTDVAASTRARLAALATTELPRVDTDLVSRDGTRKWLFALPDGNRIETVYIPERGRGTLCVSSQVGCALDCSFCSTGRQGFNRNLDVAEIVGQLWLARALLERSAAGGEPGAGRITNVVMMGMGEPLANYRALVPALKIMLDDDGFGLSKRRVTVSTSGMVPWMDRLTRDVDVALAVSLHAPNDRLRDELVPINRKYPIEELMAACRRYAHGERAKHVMFEYVMLEGVNDNPAEARELADLVEGCGFTAKVNLIPFNPFPGSGYRRSSRGRIERFAKVLEDRRIITLKRTTRGDDIDAACGQLAGDIEDLSRRELRFVEPRFGERTLS